MLFIIIWKTTNDKLNKQEYYHTGLQYGGIVKQNKIDVIYDVITHNEQFTNDQQEKCFNGFPNMMLSAINEEYGDIDDYCDFIRYTRNMDIFLSNYKEHEYNKSSYAKLKLFITNDYNYDTENAGGYESCYDAESDEEHDSFYHD